MPLQRRRTFLDRARETRNASARPSCPLSVERETRGGQRVRHALPVTRCDAIRWKQETQTSDERRTKGGSVRSVRSFLRSAEACRKFPELPQLSGKLPEKRT